MKLRLSIINLKNIYILAAGTAALTVGSALAGTPETASLLITAEPQGYGYIDLASATLIGTRTLREKIEVPASTSSYTANDLAFSGAADFDDFTELEPLVSASFDISAADPTVAYNSGGAGSYTIRGVGASRVAVLIDGVRQPLEVDFQVGGIAINSAGRDYFDPAMFEAVEIFKGTASSLYGSDALAGVVAFKTPAPFDLVSSYSSDRFFGYRFQYGSASDSFSHVVTGAFNEGALSGLVIYAKRDYGERENQAKPVNGILASPNPVSAQSDSVLAKIDYALTDTQRLEFAFEGFERSTDIDVQNIVQTDRFASTIALGASLIASTRTDTTEAAMNQSERSRYRFSLKHVLQVSDADDDAARLETLVYHQRALTEDHLSTRGTIENVANASSSLSIASRSRSEVETHYEEITTGLSSTYKGTVDHLWGTHRLLFGFESVFGSSELPFRSNGETVVTASNLSGFPDLTPGAVSNFDSNTPRLPSTDTLRAGLYAQDEFTFGDEAQWILVAGLRGDYYKLKSDKVAAFRAFVGTDAPDYSDFSISPSIALLHRLTDGSQRLCILSARLSQPNTR